MPIAEAVAQQIISAEAEVEATQMTYFRGSTNHGLEIDGITGWYGSSGVKLFGQKALTQEFSLMFWINYPHIYHVTLTFLLYFPIFTQGISKTQIFTLN